MARPLGHIRILVSARVLFNLEEADAIFKEKGEKEYVDYMRGRGAYEKDYVAELGGRKLEKGPLWDFVQAALALNEPGKEPVVEIGLLSKDTGETGLPIFRNIDVGGLKGIHFRVLTAGNKLEMAQHEAFGTDLLLTRNAEDVQLAVDNDIAAAVINIPPAGTVYNRKPTKALRIFVDGDAVAVGSESEVIYQDKGLEEYVRIEGENFDLDMMSGPFTAFLAKISAFNELFPKGEQPFELSLLTARGNEAAAHMITATEKLGIKFNGTPYFLGGAAKAPILKAERPDIFFDDQQAHLKEGQLYCPAGQVLYPTDSPMDVFLKNKEDITKKKAASEKKAAAPGAPRRTYPPRVQGRR